MQRGQQVICYFWHKISEEVLPYISSYQAETDIQIKMEEMSPENGRYINFARSVRPQWRQSSFEISHFPRSTIRVVDISSTGSIHDCHLQLSEKETQPRHIKDYETRLEAECQAIKTEVGDVKTRLVLFDRPLGHDESVMDLYGVEFRIEQSFFNACFVDNPDYRDKRFQDDPPTFLDLGKGCCARFVDQDFDHPLIRRGVTVGEGYPDFEETLCSFRLSLDLFAVSVRSSFGSRFHPPSRSINGPEL